jgi:hypothetical protein
MSNRDETLPPVGEGVPKTQGGPFDLAVPRCTASHPSGPPGSKYRFNCQLTLLHDGPHETNLGFTQWSDPR